MTAFGLNRRGKNSTSNISYGVTASQSTIQIKNVSILFSLFVMSHFLRNYFVLSRLGNWQNNKQTVTGRKKLEKKDENRT